MVTENLPMKGTIPFTAEGRLIQELGLRLVASPEVALVELIKNAFDADSPSCTVRLENKGQALVIADEGCGMSFEDFSDKWMRIATSSKLAQEFSVTYHRRLTGAKGIGRFAVRYLGDHLKLESVALDSKRGCRTRLTATFDWPVLDRSHDLSGSEVDYRLEQVRDNVPVGTSLTITKLRSAVDFVRSKELRDNVLRMVSPIGVLEHGEFANTAVGGAEDPGFRLLLPGGDAAGDVDLARLVLDNFWARLTVQLKGKDLHFRIYYPSRKKPRELNVRVETAITKGFFADIRYFPRRKGVFQGKGIHGRKAWRWVRDNCGVAVVDHGFRMQPFGFSDDDWLSLDRDRARSARDWRTEIAKQHFQVPPLKRANPAENPVLYLPYNFQLVGAVFVESRRTSRSEQESDLVPAMDRQGLLDNAGSKQLAEYVRAGIEFLAHEDKAELDRLAGIAAREAARTARDEIREVIETIQQSPGLAPRDKASLVKHYRDLSDRLDEQEEYSRRARSSLTTMSLLGVVAGFMTHESRAFLYELRKATEQVRQLSRKHHELVETAESLTRHLETFEGYVDYAQAFVKRVRDAKVQALSASGQIRRVLNRFKLFADERGIEVTYDAKDDVTTPPLAVAVYGGVLLNLYTNALKAVIAAGRSAGEPRICFRAWNEGRKHVVEVADTGVGIPAQMRKRIWDPLYTTTSDEGNPLGSGMGLGLPLIKQVVTESGGTVTLTETPPPGYTTCFRVEFPRR